MLQITVRGVFFPGEVWPFGQTGLSGGTLGGFLATSPGRMMNDDFQQKSTLDFMVLQFQKTGQPGGFRAFKMAWFQRRPISFHPYGERVHI